MAYLSPDSPALKISQNYWEYIFRHLYIDGYLEGMSLVPVTGRITPQVKLGASLMITPKGIEFLRSHPSLRQAYKYANIRYASTK